AAVDAELVLDADDVDEGHVQEVGRLPVRVENVLRDLELDLVGVGVLVDPIVHRDDVDLGRTGLRDRVREIRAERRETAAARRIAAEQRDAGRSFVAIGAQWARGGACLSNAHWCILPFVTSYARERRPTEDSSAGRPRGPRYRPRSAGRCVSNP